MTGQKVGTIVTVKFPITVTVLAGITLVVLTAMFHWLSGSAKETLVFFATGVAAVGVVVSAYYTGKTLNAMIGRNAEDAEIARRREEREKFSDLRASQLLAMRYGERWNDPAMFHVRNTLRSVMEFETHSNDELINFVSDASRRTNVIHVVNFLEEISVSIRHGLVDTDLVKAQFCGIVIATWPKLLPWISQTRRVHHDNMMWDDLEKIYNVWKSTPH
ncbi:DUF4760 domain-containing protein [Dongia sp.]|uniref:DUF4760 domain-containing protein n=1 Tax=Dongia sp. TaxID=1977262 RepID=UPI0035B47195